MPIIALSQLSRQVEQREDKRPQLSDLRESGSIERTPTSSCSCSARSTMSKARKPREGTPEVPRLAAENDAVAAKAEVIIGKQRHGPVCTVQLAFESQFTPASAIWQRNSRCPSATSDVSRSSAAACHGPYRHRSRKLVGNWRALRDLVAPAECAAVVKADAYGLESWQVIQALRTAGCKTFFVATWTKCSPHASRASKIRTFFVLDGLMPGAAQTMREVNAIPCDLEPRRRSTNGSSAGGGRAVPVALQIDTGLNRLGFSERDLDLLTNDKPRRSKLDIRLVMSHLACADEPTNPMNEAQRTAFERLRAKLPRATASPCRVRWAHARQGLSFRSRAARQCALRRTGVSRRGGRR